MDNVRLRRLKADHEAVRRLVQLHPRIEIEGVFGSPPERYRLRLKVKSLREHGTAIETADEHRLEITMPRGYPRDAPLFRMLTPVFHPNIAPHAVCVGDDWTAGEPLDNLIQRVGEILGFQSYNTKSPLNGRAAQWVEENLVNRIDPIAEGEGWREERTGMHEREFIETRRHWFTAPVTHHTQGGVNVLNLVEGTQAVVDSPSGAFEPFTVHYAETFIIPAAVGEYRISPAGEGIGQQLATIKAWVRG